jgi:hypothetical protein
MRKNSRSLRSRTELAVVASILIFMLAIAVCVVVANAQVRGFRFPTFHAAPSQR